MHEVMIQQEKLLVDVSKVREANQSKIKKLELELKKL